MRLSLSRTGNAGPACAGPAGIAIYMNGRGARSGFGDSGWTDLTQWDRTGAYTGPHQIGAGQRSGRTCRYDNCLRCGPHRPGNRRTVSWEEICRKENICERAEDPEQSQAEQSKRNICGGSPGSTGGNPEQAVGAEKGYLPAAETSSECRLRRIRHGAVTECGPGRTDAPDQARADMPGRGRSRHQKDGTSWGADPAHITGGESTGTDRRTGRHCPLRSGCWADSWRTAAESRQRPFPGRTC